MDSSTEPSGKNNQPSPDERLQTAPLNQEEADRQARIAYLKSLAPSPSPKKRWWLWLLIVLVILLLAGAVWFYMSKKTKDQSTAQKPQTQNQQKEAEETPTTETKHHDSPTFALGFDYPADWTVTETDGRLTAVSKTMKLKTAGGQSLNGRIQVLIQPKQSTIKEFSKGNGVAILDSEKISYTKPTQTQRAQTYLSFVNYSGSTETGIDALYITGDIGYQKDQAVPMVDIVRVDPLITASFVQCPNEACSGATAPLTLDASSWKEKVVLSSAIKTVLTTLSIQ
jgi:hypothetical protein